MTVTLARPDSGVVTTLKNPSKQQPQCDECERPIVHHLVREVKTQVDDYVCSNWEFADDESKKAFISANISSLACYNFPSALDERIFVVSRLLAVLFLIAENLLQFDIDDAEEYIEALEAAVKGHWLPDESIPAVWMTCGVFDEIRGQDYMVADDIIDTVFAHLRGGLVRRGRSTQRRGTGSSTSTFRVGASLLSSLEPLSMGMSTDSTY